MRRILGYVDGRAIWSENVPANPGSMPIRGALVVGAPGPYETARARDRKFTIAAAKERLDEERVEARRVAFRESKRRARARAKRYNDDEGSGLESNSISTDLRRAATTRGPEVAVSIEVVAR